ncbi:RNA methyltransferase [Sandaracinobacter sp. RS1-74]|uniref:TrmH family RNA methyltransferase n=1 Tax=Sandaracinobacteroides sayramensis TaxID=2913411 RepID=UPI001EDB014B|nr:RNA methyltransferase [Sandaracinobacteroides sayramensis]MCG2840714.1 RNA methyltransferase [Sandaracinobacteroides sayramensis]
MITHVTSASNATLKRLRSLKEKKYRRAEGLFLAEGLRICTEALEAGWVPKALLFAEGKGEHPLVRRLVQAVLAGGGTVVETTPDLLSGVTGKDNPQAVAAAYEPRALSLDQLVPGPRTLVAERLRDPGNLGTLLRACDATGTGALILLDDSADPTSVEAVRASMGAFFTVPCVNATMAEFLDWKARHGAILTGAALDRRAVDYRAARYPAPALLMVGNEAQGLPEELMAACEQLVIMPMRGKADSLNVAMAGTLLLYEALYQQEG